MTHQLTEDQIRRAEDAADELAADAGYADMLAHPETIVDAFDLFDTVPVCSQCRKPDNSVSDLGSSGLCATCQTAAVGLDAARPHYRDDVSEAYDLGYARGFINAPRAEHDECYDSAGWLVGWEDGMADWDGQR